MDIVGAVTAVYEIVGPTFLRQCGYIVSCNSHVSSLKHEIKNLRDALDRLHHEVDLAESVGDIIEHDVWTWLNDAEELIKSKNLILEKKVVSCCFGFVPNPRTRYVLGRRAKKSLPDLRALIERGKFDGVSFHPPVELKVRSATSSSTVRYVDLKSRASVLKKIMADLNDHNKVGVYGMGGVGKTTLLKDVEKKARESGKFDDVVTVFVSQAPNIESIKSKILNKLGSLSSNGDEANKKTLLILLDDLWSKLKDFDALENSCEVKIKWVMTSRKQELLAKGMDCYPTIYLGVLEEEEVWSFFGELVNNNKVEELKNNPAVAALLKKCAGLPVSIEALANVLEKKGLSSSDLVNADVLKLGKESINGYASLELSYNYLGDTDVANLARSLFRIIGLLGTPTVPILTLLKYTIGLGLLGSTSRSSDNNIMERARRQVSTSLRMLQDASLLLESDDSDYVKIHDVVRDVAVNIASRDDGALIFDHEDGLKGWSKEKLRKSTSMYLQYSVIPKLNEGWECPELRIFIMEAGPAQGDHILSRRKKRRDHVRLPSSFYKGMAKLKVVDLRNARLTSLPSSIQSDLCKLTTLFLHFCCIEDVSVIGKLKSLQILSFVGSDLAHLPKEIGNLTKLRLLDLSKCSKLKTIEPGTLKGLTRLEELYIKESFDGWEVEGIEKPSNSSLAELNFLPRLKTLEVCVPDTNTLPLSLPIVDLVRYKVLIGESWDWSGEYRESRTLKFKEKSKNILTEEWLQSALRKTQDLHLEGLNGIMESFHELCREGFEELKHLHLQNSSSIECIIWSTMWLECSAFTALESMILKKMGSLEKICDGRISSSSFSKLKVVKVQQCHKLRSLFNLSLLKNLTELEEIEINDCEMLQQIVLTEPIKDDSLIATGGDATVEEQQNVAMSGCSNIFFGRPAKRPTKDAEEFAVADHEIQKLLVNLRYLTLINLPEITSFFTTESSSESAESSVAAVFFNGQRVSQLPKCKEIQSTALLRLDKLQRIELIDCKSVVHFSNSQVLLKLVNLESLTIAGCESLEDIFNLEGIEPESGNVEFLPKLYELKLRGLPKLEHIWKKNHRQIKGCRKLRRVEIYRCFDLLYFSSSFMCEAMDNLTEINIGYCYKMETIFLEEEGDVTNSYSVKTHLTSLKILGITGCPNLKTFLWQNRQIVSIATSSDLSVNSSTDSKCNSKRMAYWCNKKKAVDTSNSFFSQKVFLPSLESLILSRAGKFEKLWCEEIPLDQSYCKLEYLHVEWCQNLRTVIPASLIERLHNLKQLWVFSCSEIEVIVDLDVGWKTKKKSKVLMLPQLQEITLVNLTNLRRVIERGSDDEIVVGFPSLKRLKVCGCSELINLISTTTATTLLECTSLDISRCDKLLEVIGGEVSEMYKRKAITFPHLTSLSLSYLDSLTCFSSESHRFDFTCLKILKIEWCISLKKLAKSRSDGRFRSQDEEDQANTANIEVLFNEKIQVPNLEELYISYSGGLEELWNEPPTGGSFCKLKVLEILECSSIQSVIPSFMVNMLQNIERISISRCDSLQDIFKTTSSTKQIQSSDDFGIVEEHVYAEERIGKSSRQIHEKIIAFTKLTSLKLEDNIQLNNLLSGSLALEMPSLKTLILHRTNGAAMEAIMEKVHLPSLEELVISSSEEITEVWHTEPHVGSFNKLKRLQVEQCGGLVKIIPFFMLKRLQNLEELVVKNCDNLEIVCELKWLIDQVQDSESSKLQPCFPFQMLASLHVEKCKCLRNLFSISEKGETTDDSEDKIVQLPQLACLRLEDLPKFIQLLFQQDLLAGQYALEFPSLKEFFLIEAGDKEAVTHKVTFPEKLEIHVSNMSFFGSTTGVMTDIVKALQQENQVCIIGLLGSMEEEMRVELKQLVQEEENLFDLVVDRRARVSDIQYVLGIELGIVYAETDEEGRAKRLRKSLLSYIRNKRLLLIFTGIEDEGILEAAGIPVDHGGFDPKHFKILLFSTKKELLLKMGAQLTIPIGLDVGDRWLMFGEELLELDSQKAELPAFDTKMDHDICSFVGPSTVLLNNMMTSMRSHKKKNQIIGMLGPVSDFEDLLSEIQRLVGEEVIFDEVVLPYKNEMDEIQRELEISLGMMTSSSEETATGLQHENKAQYIRQSLLSSNQERKRLLLIMDDLDQEVDLEAVGIPRLEDGLVDPKLFKIILKSENRQVVQKMGAQQIFEFGSEIKGSPSFCRILDGYVERSDIVKLADECGSEDLAKLLSKKLKDQGMHAWANAFRRLKESPFVYEERRKVIASL